VDVESIQALKVAILLVLQSFNVGLLSLRSHPKAEVPKLEPSTELRWLVSVLQVSAVYPFW
jgi:hypothetical protein